MRGKLDVSGNTGFRTDCAAALDCEGKSSHANARLLAAISPLSEQKLTNETTAVVANFYCEWIPEPVKLGMQNDTLSILCQSVENYRSVLR
jgi:hypothetical protein